MADEQLRLVASVKDEFSAPLRNLRGQLAGIKNPPGIKEMSTGLKQWQSDMRSARTELQTALAPAMSAFGVSAFGVGAGLASLAIGVRGFSQNTQTMRLFGKEIGLTTDRVKALSEIGTKFGVSSETMLGGTKALRTAMGELKNGFGGARQALINMNQGDLLDSLKGATSMQDSIDRLFAGLRKIPDPEKRRRLLAAMGLPEDWSVIAGEVANFGKAVDEIQKRQGETGKVTETAAATFEENMSRMRQSLENLKVKGFTPLLIKANEFMLVLERPDSIKKFEGFMEEMQARLRTTREEFEGIKSAWSWFANKLPDSEVKPLTNNDEVLKRQSKIGKLQRQVDSNAAAGLDAQYPEAQRDLKDEIKKLTDEIRKLREEGATATKSSFDPPGDLRSMIQRASFGGVGNMGGGAGSGAVGFGMRGRYRFGPGGGDGTGGDKVDTGGSSAGNLTKLIEEESRRAGIDPRIMQGIRAGESGHGSHYDKKDDRQESSWGPFQLNRRRGLGVQFEKETGLDVRDPRTIAAQARWVANFIKKGGSLGNWMGYHGPRNADPKWGDSGYVPEPAAPAKRTNTTSWKGTDWEANPPGGFLLSGQPAKGWSGGDAMMGRAFAPGGVGGTPAVDAKGSVHVTLGPGLEKMPASVSYDGMFTDVTVNRGGRQMAPAGEKI